MKRNETKSNLWKRTALKAFGCIVSCLLISYCNCLTQSLVCAIFDVGILGRESFVLKWMKKAKIIDNNLFLLWNWYLWNVFERQKREEFYVRTFVVSNWFHNNNWGERQASKTNQWKNNRLELLSWKPTPFGRTIKAEHWTNAMIFHPFSYWFCYSFTFFCLDFQPCCAG